MWTLPARIAVAVTTIGLTLSGCRETVSHPMPPLQARTQVVDAARDIVSALHADVSEASRRQDVFSSEPSASAERRESSGKASETGASGNGD